MLYRAHANLSFGQKKKMIAKGEVINNGKLSEKAASILLDRGLISIVRSPPVAVYLPLEKYEKRLKDIGVIYTVDFLEAPNREIFDKTNIPISVIINMKIELRKMLDIPLSSLTKECCGG